MYLMEPIMYYKYLYFLCILKLFDFSDMRTTFVFGTGEYLVLTQVISCTLTVDVNM
jgi:hypothetical protein